MCRSVAICVCAIGARNRSPAHGVCRGAPLRKASVGRSETLLTGAILDDGFRYASNFRWLTFPAKTASLATYTVAPFKHKIWSLQGAVVLTMSRAASRRLVLQTLLGLREIHHAAQCCRRTLMEFDNCFCSALRLLLTPRLLAEPAGRRAPSR